MVGGKVPSNKVPSFSGDGNTCHEFNDGVPSTNNNSISNNSNEALHSPIEKTKKDDDDLERSDISKAIARSSPVSKTSSTVVKPISNSSSEIGSFSGSVDESNNDRETVVVDTVAVAATSATSTESLIASSEVRIIVAISSIWIIVICSRGF